MQVFNETRNATAASVSRWITIPAVSLATLMYLAIGLAVYLTYGSEVKPNAVLTFPLGNTTTQVAEIMMAFIAAASFPLMIHAGRAALTTLIQQASSWNRRPAEAEGQGVQEGQKIETYRKMSTEILLALVFVVGFLSDDVGFVFELTGSIAGTALTLYIPGWLFWRLFEDETGSAPASDSETAVAVRQEAPGPILSAGWLKLHRLAALCMGISGPVLTAIFTTAALCRPRQTEG